MIREDWMPVVQMIGAVALSILLSAMWHASTGALPRGEFYAVLGLYIALRERAKRKKWEKESGSFSYTKHTYERF